MGIIMEKYNNKVLKSGIKEVVLQTIIEKARKYDIQQVILFGSRARGDFHETSDIDLAVRGGNNELFALEVEEETYTLLKYDIVDLEKNVQPELQKAIEEEGILIYEEI